MGYVHRTLVLHCSQWWKFVDYLLPKLRFLLLMRFLQYEISLVAINLTQNFAYSPPLLAGISVEVRLKGLIWQSKILVTKYIQVF